MISASSWKYSSNSRESSKVLPPFKNSSVEIRTIIGKKGPTCALTSFRIKEANLALFSALPPNSSVLLFVSGDKNWLIK